MKIDIAAAGIAFFRSASAKMMLADLPPNSKDVLFNDVAARDAMSRAVAGDPVNSCGLVLPQASEYVSATDYDGDLHAHASHIADFRANLIEGDRIKPEFAFAHERFAG